MKITMVSNFLNHHQLALARELARQTDGNFHFIATERVSGERQALGYQDLEESFLIRAYKGDWEQAKKLLRESEVVILGSCPEELAQIPIRAGTLTFRFAERPLRRGVEPLKYLPRLLRWHSRNPIWQNVHLLCAGAYTGGDYRKFGLFCRRAYRWGYFPETRRYDSIETLLTAKDPIRLLWAGRLIPLKHPEQALEVARRLKERGHGFQLDMIGAGELEDALRKQIRQLGLAEQVHLLGPMSPERVRDHMEKAGIFLFTSDEREGWGAVVNEAMNSGCALVAWEGAGSLPYLVRDGENGILIPGEDTEGMVRAVAELLKRPEKQRRLGGQAYRTITELWNGETAADRFVELCHHLRAGEPWPDLYSDGPCSREH